MFMIFVEDFNYYIKSFDCERKAIKQSLALTDYSLIKLL